MNLSTAFVLAILIIAVVFAVRYTMKHGLDDCGGNCTSCHGSCDNIKKGLIQARKELEEEKKLGQF